MYDINGNKVIDSSAIKNALIGAVADGTVNLGSQIGATLTYTSPSDTWETNGETAYQLLLNAYKESPNSAIPFFITTDQHSRGVEPNRWLNNKDVDGMNVMNINLGDTVQDYFNFTEINNILARTKQVKNYIGVIGNHECVYKNDTMTKYDLCRTYATTNLVRKMPPSETNSYAVIDDLHNAKFIVLEEYIINASGNGIDRGLSKETTEWLIRELSVNDGYDIVILKHWGFKFGNRGQWLQRNGTVMTNESAYLENLTDMMIARKNKTSGTFTDVDGNVHSYDFSDCESDLLCALHGHEHQEIYGYADKLLCYCADWLGDDMNCTFGLIDRANGKLRVWIASKIGVLDEFSMDLNI